MQCKKPHTETDHYPLQCIAECNGGIDKLAAELSAKRQAIVQIMEHFGIPDHGIPETINIVDMERPDRKDLNEREVAEIQVINRELRKKMVYLDRVANLQVLTTSKNPTY